MRALGGYTDGSFVDTLFDTEDFKEQQYAEKVQSETGNVDLVMNWYNSLKVRDRSHRRNIRSILHQLVAYYCLGYSAEAAKLGFYVYNTRHKHPKYSTCLGNRAFLLTMVKSQACSIRAILSQLGYDRMSTQEKCRRGCSHHVSRPNRCQPGIH